MEEVVICYVRKRNSDTFYSSMVFVQVHTEKQKITAECV